MKIRRIKAGATIYCGYCKAQGVMKVPAEWHLTGENKQSCGIHRELLEVLRDEGNASMNRELSEADYQTWMKL